MFAKILIANRGEIACRVIHTARRLGTRTVAVYSDADRDARHARLADEAWRIGPPPAQESYLDIEANLAAARASGAEAIHPGYGFLSENAEFAAACARAGVVFIGPSAAAITAMGDKSSAKQRMEQAGVPILPGYHGDEQDPGFLEKQARRIGYPVLIKPSAGGGGKGMRIVKEASSFLSSLEAARREAKSAFGDERVLIERYLERPRHIEVQVFGDTHGNLVHLFERDCSVQRRHQKVLEEAPAPGISAEQRAQMGAAALAVAKAIGYAGAGTVEFICEPNGKFYFMEMNTRLQVEHPVTEMITGLDLVEWQLRIAAGETLPRSQEQLSFSGHAIEARLYAEDPERDFLPATGKLLHLSFPAESAEVRIDTGVDALAEITPWYDPMIAKLIVRGADRASALARLQQALSEVEIAGPATNVGFLRRVAASRAFSGADLDTSLIERSRPELFPPRVPAAEALIAAAVFAQLAEEEQTARARARASADPFSPWNHADGWRLNQDSHLDFHLTEAETQHVARVRFLAHGKQLSLNGGAERSFEGERLPDGTLLLRLDSRAFKARAARDGAHWHVFCGGDHRRLSLREELEGFDVDTSAGSLAAPMSGKVIQVLARVGAQVAKGEALLILEAMKMEHTVTAPADGMIKEIHYQAGEQVPEGAQLITLE